MTESTSNGQVALDLTREEAWVAHAALAWEIDRQLDDEGVPVRERTLLLAIERGEPVDVDAARCLRDAVVAYLDDAPERDVVTGRAVLGTIDAALAGT